MTVPCHNPLYIKELNQESPTRPLIFNAVLALDAAVVFRVVSLVPDSRKSV
jgi:hypothetical protein